MIGKMVLAVSSGIMLAIPPLFNQQLIENVNAGEPAIIGFCLIVLGFAIFIEGDFVR